MPGGTTQDSDRPPPQGYQNCKKSLVVRLNKVHPKVSISPLDYIAWARKVPHCGLAYLNPLIMISRIITRNRKHRWATAAPAGWPCSFTPPLSLKWTHTLLCWISAWLLFSVALWSKKKTARKQQFWSNFQVWWLPVGCPCCCPKTVSLSPI